MSPLKLVLLVTACYLEGCATSALRLAPETPSRPWVPKTDKMGEIIPGKQGSTQYSKLSSFTLPKNTKLSVTPSRLVSDAKKSYSLPELIDIAESNNPETTIVWNEAKKIALDVGLAESAYLPRLSANVLGVYRGTDGHNATLNTDNNTSLTGMVASLSLQWLLFDFGKRSALLTAAEQASIISNVTFNATHQKIIHDVALAYYRFLSVDARYKTAEISLNNTKAVLAAAQAKYKHGIGTIMEVSQAQETTAQANFNLVQAQGAKEDGYLALMSSMGISPLTKLAITDAAVHELDPKLNEPVERIISDALARRPDILAAYAAEKASWANVKAANAEFLPKFFLSANGSYNSNHLNISSAPSVGQESPTLNLNGDSLGGTVFLGMVMPIYDGGSRAAALAKAKADVEASAAKLTQVKNEAIRQIVVAENALKTSLSAHEASETLADTAQTAYDAALSAYQNGIGSITDVTIAENRLLQARNAMTDTYSASLAAAASLALATGDLVDPP